MQTSLIKDKGILRVNGLDSRYILSLLEAKHSKDVFIPECKNGETWGARDLLKLDAWVLLRTYSPLTTIGYELKCSRADFEQDQKWVKYLDLCHLFYFVCPAGLIRSTDIPSRVGLIWVSSSGKLHTKKKAERQEPDGNKLNGLLIYALMARSHIVANMYDINKEELPNRLQEIRVVVERAKERQELAYFVKGHIREIFEEAQKRHLEFNFREQTIARFEEHLARLGIEWDSEASDWQQTMRVENEIEMLGKQISDLTLRRMDEVAHSLIATADAIKKYRQNGRINKG